MNDTKPKRMRVEDYIIKKLSDKIKTVNYQLLVISLALGFIIGMLWGK